MSPEVLVLGGGPAGCAAARLLAGWGHRVRLIAREEAGPPLAQSIPPSGAKLFDLLGISSAIDRAGFVRSTGHTVWWGDEPPRVEPFAAGQRGWQVTSDALDRVLLAAAEEAGVEVARRRATAEDAAGAPLVLDGTGRAGVMARARGWRVPEPAHHTVALAGAWRPGRAWAEADPTHTLIESYAHGWAWSVPAADGRRHLAVMVDPRTSSLERGRPAREVYEAEIRRTKRFAALVADATLEGGPWGWDASLYSAGCYADDQLLLVGDAASFVDPLSSAGVTKALASGWLAAVAAHTALIRPAMRRTAFDFFAAREAEVYSSLLARTREFFAGAAASHAHPFWADRASIGEPPTAPAGLARDAAAAHARLRDADTLHVRAASGLRTEPRPVVRGAEIVLEPRLMVEGWPDGVRYLYDVDLLVLMPLAPAARQVPDLYESYVRKAGPVALPDFLRALATALGAGWLEWDEVVEAS